jgi:hypothetical protein
MKEQIEKQAIEEMANEICGICHAYKNCVNTTPCTMAYVEAEGLCKNKGYRKQSVGKWIWINQATGYLEPPYGDTCKCSLCEFVIDISESNYNFFPNCGARMKGAKQ